MILRGPYKNYTMLFSLIKREALVRGIARGIWRWGCILMKQLMRHNNTKLYREYSRFIDSLY